MIMKDRIMNLIRRYMKGVFAFFFLFAVAASGQDIVQRNLLRQFSKEQVAASLLPYNIWKPFPQTASAWSSVVPDSIRKRVISAGKNIFMRLLLLCLPRYIWNLNVMATGPVMKR